MEKLLKNSRLFYNDIHNLSFWACEESELLLFDVITSDSSQAQNDKNKLVRSLSKFYNTFILAYLLIFSKSILNLIKLNEKNRFYYVFAMPYGNGKYF